MIDLDISKYEESVIKNIHRDNLEKIITFLVSKGCDYVEELLEDYLDLFTFDYHDFVTKFNKLDEKYQHHFIDEVREDMNLLEEFYYA